MTGVQTCALPIFVAYSENEEKYFSFEEQDKVQQVSYQSDNTRLTRSQNGEFLFISVGSTEKNMSQDAADLLLKSSVSLNEKNDMIGKMQIVFNSLGETKTTQSLAIKENSFPFPNISSKGGF